MNYYLDQLLYSGQIFFLRTLGESVADGRHSQEISGQC